MDSKDWEFLFRKTTFCRALLSEAWDALNGGQRIELLLQLGAQSVVLPETLQSKAFADPNPVVRMLAVKYSYIVKGDSPGLDTKLMGDVSPFVRAVMKAETVVDSDVLKPLDHIERLGVIALTDTVDDTSFAEFIVESLKNHSISEHEADELVTEFVHNPNLVRIVERKVDDGLDWYMIKKNFEAIWQLTTCTPPVVHREIAWKYPLFTGSRDTISDELLDHMSKLTLGALAFRQHKPLLKRLQTYPERFGEDIHRSAEEGARYGTELPEPVALQTRLDEFHAEMRETIEKFRAEIQESMKSLSRQIAEVASRRRGLFG